MATTKLTTLRNDTDTDELDSVANTKSQSSNPYHIQNSSVSEQQCYPHGFFRKVP